ncbi:MAG: hypothetical protein K2K58_02385, partial [Muribaculaceae bacterium]|nr:hypothetical protein [Muribaculaceae bacterium]
GVKPCENGFEAIHPSICTFDFPSMFMNLIVIDPFLRAFPLRSWDLDTLGMHDCLPVALPWQVESPDCPKRKGIGWNFFRNSPGKDNY